MELKIEKLTAITPTALWTKVKGVHEVAFFDGIATLTATEIILSAYIWRVAALFNVRPSYKHTIKEHFKRGVLCPASVNDAYNAVLWYCVDTLQVTDDPVTIFKIVKSIMVSNNMLYNDLVTNTSEHLVDIDLLSFIDLAENPTMLGFRKESNDADDTPDSVSMALYKAEQYVLNDDEIDKTSTITWHCRRNLVNTGQVLQACLLRGYVHDIDRARINKPILSNLTEGMCLTNYALLSRESSISMAAGNGDIQCVSVDGRRMSYVGGTKSRIMPGDCKTEEYVSWKVNKSDGNALHDTWFFSDDNPTLRLYTAEDAVKYEHQHIYRRSPLTCKLKNASHTCSKCYGKLSESMPANRNVGITIAKYIAAIFVQGTLSTKHYVVSMGSAKNVLNEETAMYFKMKDDAIYLKKKPGIKKLELTINISSLYDIQAIFNVPDVKFITMSRITSISKGAITLTKTQTSHDSFFDVAEGKNKSMLSYQLAVYIQKNKHVLTTRGDKYIIDITDFDKAHPVFIRAAKMANFRDSSSKIIATLERAGSKPNDSFDKSYGIMDTLVWLIELMAAKYGISASAVELLFSAYLSEEETYRLPRGIQKTKHRKIYGIIRNRSLSFWFLFDRSAESFTTPGPMLVDKRVNGPLDVIVSPTETLKALSKK